MLAENRRLGYLPEIAALFEELKDDEEDGSTSTVTSAPRSLDEQQSRYAEALQQN